MVANQISHSFLFEAISTYSRSIKCSKNLYGNFIANNFLELKRKYRKCFDYCGKGFVLTGWTSWNHDKLSISSWNCILRKKFQHSFEKSAARYFHITNNNIREHSFSSLQPTTSNSTTLHNNNITRLAQFHIEFTSRYIAPVYHATASGEQ